MTRTTAWSVAGVLFLLGGIAALIAGETVMALALLAVGLCMFGMGGNEKYGWSRRGRGGAPRT